MMNFMLNDMDVELERKKIKNIYLSVYPPTGAIKVSAPVRMSLEVIRSFIVAKTSWIKKQKIRLLAQERETTREYIDRESHYFNGQRYLLKLVEQNAVPKVYLAHSEIVLQVRPNADKAIKSSVLDAWYRQQLRERLYELVALWENKIGVSVEEVKIQRMKTRWGSCSPSSKSIRINLELIKKPPECLEYIVVHELVHLLEPSHNKRFVSLMDNFLPKWRLYRSELNALPLTSKEEYAENR